MRRSIIVAAAFAALFVHPASAAGPDDQIPPTMRAQLRFGSFIEGFVANLLAPLRQLDIGRDGLDAADLALVNERLKRQKRTTNLSTIFSFDLNGDASVTRDEVRIALIQARGTLELTAIDTRNIDGRVNRQMRADKNGDGSISVAEAIAFDPDPGSPIGDQAGVFKAYLDLDPNKDGKLTGEELTGLGRKWFGMVDTNGDGYLDRTESEVLIGLAAQAPPRAKGGTLDASQCTLPTPAEAQQVVAFGVYEGSAYSTVAVAGVNDDTTTLRVTIEPGSDAIYLILSSFDPTIWRIEGARDRIARVVLVGKPVSGGGIAAGVVGVGPSKVTFAPPTCNFHLYEADVTRMATARAMIADAVGRSENIVVAASYSARGVRLPSGEVDRSPANTAPPTGFDADAWADALRFRPGGLVTMNPRMVFAEREAVAYDVLPQQAGIAQLLGNGSLTRLARSAGYRIVKPIPHYPAGLAGSHAVHLFIAAGVPQPAGDPLHSCVILEETGRPLGDGHLCGMH